MRAIPGGVSAGLCVGREGQTGLDLVADHEDVEFRAQRADAGEILIIRHHNSRLTLYRLHQKRRNPVRMFLKNPLHSIRISKRNHLPRIRIPRPHARQKRPVIITRSGIRRHRDRRECAAVEVLPHAEDERLIGRDALRFIPPFAREF